MKLCFSLILVLCSIDASHAQEDNFVMKPLSRIQSSDQILAENSWLRVSDRIKATLRVASDTEANSIFVKAYFFDKDHNLVFTYREPCTVFKRVRNGYATVGVPEILKKGVDADVYFALTPSLRDKNWTSLVVVFGNNTEAVARSYPPAAFPNLEFPERKLVKDSGGGDSLSSAAPLAQMTAPQTDSFATNTVAKKPSPTPQQQPVPPADHQQAKQPAQKAASQEIGTLLAPLQVELKLNGKAVGSTTLKEGTSLPIVKRDGSRVLVKHAAGESWVQSASEWDITPIADISSNLDRDNDLGRSIQSSIAIVDGEPCVAWITRSGLFFARQKAGQWETEKIDDFEKSNLKGISTGRCVLRILEGGRPYIAYAVDYEPNNLIIKMAMGDKNGWKLQAIQHETSSLAGRLDIGQWKGKPAVIRYIVPSPTLWVLENGVWNQQPISDETEGFLTYPHDVLLSQNDTIDLLAVGRHNNGTAETPSDKNDFWAALSHFDGKKWGTQKISNPQPQGVSAHYLARYAKQIYATFSDASTQRLNLARQSASSWENMPMDPQKLLEPNINEPPDWDLDVILGLSPAKIGRNDLSLFGMAAADQNKVGLLLVQKPDDSSEKYATHFCDITFPQLCIIEKVTDGFPCSLVLDEKATPHIVFVSENGQLTLVSRKRTPQISVGKPIDRVLRAPDATQRPRTTTTKVLPEVVYPGSEQEKMQRVEALGKPQEFSLPVGGKDARFTRWGSGEKAVVFFTAPPEWIKDYDGKFVERYDDAIAASVAAQIDAYAQLMESGYSIVTWDYPDQSGEKVENIDEVLLKPRLSGIASDLIKSLREKAGLAELILVGSGFVGEGESARLLLWDLTALENDEKSKVILISPNLYKLPNLSKLPLKTTAVVIANPPPEGSKPEAEAWIKANRSDATDTLAPTEESPGLGENISHETFAQWLVESVIKKPTQ